MGIVKSLSRLDAPNGGSAEELRCLSHSLGGYHRMEPAIGIRRSLRVVLLS
jgi:hypothetical protein